LVFTAFKNHPLKKQNPKSKNQNPKARQESKFQRPEGEMMEPTKPRDLQERTYLFAGAVRELAKRIPRTIGNIEELKPLVRCSGSVAANFVEANESISKRDFVFRIKICRKEAKENHLWLRVLDTGNNLAVAKDRDLLMSEAHELVLIFSSIVSKVK
jgi:four helix bundle protein